MLRSIFGALALGATLVTGALPAAAQVPPPPPGYGDFGPRTFQSPHRVQGFVTAFSGFNLMLRIHGGPQPVNLHQGTILRPLGLTMVPGMLVRADGYFNGNGVFVAERITLVR